MKRIILLLGIFSMIMLCGVNTIEAEDEVENQPIGNNVSLNVSLDESYRELISINPQCYSMEGIEYTIYLEKDDSEIAVFILDQNGIGYHKETGLPYVDQLENGDYYIEMTKGNQSYPIDNREYPFTISSVSQLPETIKVTTVCEMYGKNSSNSYFSNNQYKLWTTSYGTGVFECGIAEVSAPSEIVSYGTHTISTKTSKVLDKESNELIYKILYYGRSGPSQWSGFTSGRYNAPFTTRDGSNYYSTSSSKALAAFITHVCLARAYGKNSKWQLQWQQDGVADYWSFVNKAENAPDNFIVYVWENYEQYGTQDMFFGFYAPEDLYDNKQLSIQIAPAFDPISIVLTKANSEGTPIEKAGFEISYYTQAFDSLDQMNDATSVRSWLFETDEKGMLRYSAESLISGDELFIDKETGNTVLLAGSYIAKELYAPAGYVLAEPFIIQVSSDISQSPIYLNSSGGRLITNEDTGYDLLELKEGYALVNKRAKQKTDQSLANAQYGIYMDSACQILAKDTNGNEAILITDCYGNTNTIAIAPDDYYVKEIKAPAGFRLDKTVYPITVTEQETVTVESVEESYLINVSFTKSDAINKEKIAGAIYGIYLEDDSLYCQVTIDQDGSASIVLPYRSQGYILKEIQAPIGYDRDETAYQIIGEKDSDIELTFDLYDDPFIFHLQILKQAEDGTALAEVGFQIVNEENEIVLDAFGNECAGYTDENGQLAFTLRENGVYYLVETKAAKGYRLDEQKRKIVADEDSVGTIHQNLLATSITIINYHIPVAETGDKEWIAFVILSITSFAGLIGAIVMKKRVLEKTIGV